jgi:hypothetical protein
MSLEVNNELIAKVKHKQNDNVPDFPILVELVLHQQELINELIAKVNINQVTDLTSDNNEYLLKEYSDWNCS